MFDTENNNTNATTVVADPPIAFTGDDVSRTGQIDIEPKALELLRAEKGKKRAGLTILDGMDAGSVIPIEGNIVRIGRDPTSDVYLRDDGISRNHAEFWYDSATGRAGVRDMGSTNGTFVRGIRVKEAEIVDGDKLLLGRCTVLKFELQDVIEQNYQDSIYESSVRDALTGIYNRKYLIERLVSDLSYARRHRIPLTFLIFDIDYFKKVNDTYGHQTGDRALVAVSQAIQSIVRVEDIVARYGGEEFAIIAQGTDYEGGKIFGERVRTRVARAQFEAVGNAKTMLNLTISVGVSTIDRRAVVDSSRVIAVADENLYRAKEGGRNCVVASELK